jgi:hypothetical protein
MVVYAMEEFEFPKDIPMACLSAGVVPFIETPSAAIVSSIRIVFASRDVGVGRNIWSSLSCPFATSNFFSSHTREISLAPFLVWAEAGQGPHYFRKAEKQPRQPHPNLRDQQLPPFWPQRWQHRILCSQGRLLIQSLCLPIQNYRSNSVLVYDTFLQIPLSPPSQENYVPTGARMPSG